MSDLDLMKLREIAERAQDGGSWSGKIEPESYPESDDADLPFVVKDEQNRLVAYLPEHYSDRYRPYEADGEYIATFDPPTILALILRAGGALVAGPVAGERQPRFAIGQPVEVPDTCQYFADWRGQTLWIAGVQFDYRKRRLDYTVSEHWPPRHNGDLSDGWAEHDLTEARSA